MPSLVGSEMCITDSLIHILGDPCTTTEPIVSQFGRHGFSLDQPGGQVDTQNRATIAIYHWSSSQVRACAAQFATHAPQKLHMYGCLLAGDLKIACCGQLSTHAPQSVHVDSSIT